MVTEDDSSGLVQGVVGRRSVVRAAAWSVPVVAMTAGVPALAVSVPGVITVPFSTWDLDTLWGTVAVTLEPVHSGGSIPSFEVTFDDVTVSLQAVSPNPGGGYLISFARTGQPDPGAVLTVTIALAGYNSVQEQILLRPPNSLVIWGYTGGTLHDDMPTGTGFTAIAAGDYHSVALDADGRLVTWGDTAHGQRDDMPTGTGYTAIAAGHAHSVALDADGRLVTWGDTTYGQRDDMPTGTGFTAIAAGDYHSVALDADGRLAIWGGTTYGQLDDMPTGTGFTAIAACQMYSVALRH